jgi:hypothetical protein
MIDMRRRREGIDDNNHGDEEGGFDANFLSYKQTVLNGPEYWPNTMSSQ